MAAIALALICSPEGSSQDGHMAVLRDRYIILNAAVTSKHICPAGSLQQGRQLPLVEWLADMSQQLAAGALM